jgi:hypothetical protein
MQDLVLQISLVRHAILIENVEDMSAAVHTSGMLENHTLLNDFNELDTVAGNSKVVFEE